LTLIAGFPGVTCSARSARGQGIGAELSHAVVEIGEDPRVAILDRDGLRINYEVHGAAAGRPPLLLTHGFGASGGMWSPNVAALASNRQVITWDMRGHGASDAPDDQSLYSHTACVGDMAALLDTVGAARAVVGGMSLGGYLSLIFHLSHPERAAGLLLIDTGPGFRDEQARESWNRWALGAADRLEESGTAGLNGGPEQVQANHVHGGRGLAHAARGMLVQHDSTVIDSLAQIAVPTLILLGGRDEDYLAAAEVMANRIPRARKVVLAGAGHAANMDAPEEFNIAVREFLEEL